MEKLKKDSQKLYIWITFGLVVMLSVLNSLFDEIMKLNWNAGWTLFFLVLYFLGHIALFFLAAWLFWRQINLRINQEQDRIRQETNLVFANIAHDLKTPLTSVVGYSRALSQGITKTPDQTLEISQLIYQKSLRANELLDEMFEYAKLNSQDLSLILEEVDIAEFTRQIIAENYDYFEKEEMPLTLKIAEKPIIKKVDKNKMKRAITNIITNAYTHNDKGTLIIIGVNSEGITITDSGQAISQEEFHHFTQPFVSGQADRNSQSSSGLGLAITDAIVSQHGFNLILEDAKSPYTKTIGIKF